MTDVQVHLDRLDQRRRWLTERIKAKQIIGWDVEYDISERDALEWAVLCLQFMADHWILGKPQL